MPDEPEFAKLSALFEAFGATQAAGQSPVYEMLSAAVARDDEVLGLMMGTGTEQRKPSLLFACVNALLADHSADPLAAYYPIHGGERGVDDELVPTFVAFCRRYRDPLVTLLLSRSTQTNEPRRAIALHLAVSHLIRQWDSPVAVAEIGASAGLNLSFDRYRYGVDEQEVSEPEVGATIISTKVLEGDLKELLTPAPTVTARLGVDYRPVDLKTAEGRAWLEAFVWPEQVADLTMLRGAVETTLTAGISVVRGDAARDVGNLLSQLPGREPIVVFTASLLSYLNPADRTAFLHQLDELAQHRPIAWAFAEAPGLLALADIAVQGPLKQRNTHYLIGTSIRGNHRQDVLLALADPYLRHLSPSRHPADNFEWTP